MRDTFFGFVGALFRGLRESSGILAYKNLEMTKGAHSRLRYRNITWLFNNRIRFLMGIVVLISLFVLAGRVSTIMGWHHHVYELNSQERFTVLINTWRRPDLLKKSVQHYSFCPNVDAIRVVWSESKEPPSDALFSVLLSSVKAASRKSTHNIDLKIDMHDEDNLNTRFKPLDDLATDGIFSVDDDVVVPCKTLAFAFTVWSSAQDTMVGFVPRMHWLRSEPQEMNPARYLYGGWWSVWWTGTYSMVLSKCAFFHRKYLDLYTNHMPTQIRDYVTQARNCEDIAMSFLVANSTGGPPIWVKGNLFEIGTTGISSLKGHSKHRTACLNTFVDMYGRMPLVPSDVKAMDARSTWFWFLFAMVSQKHRQAIFLAALAAFSNSVV